MMQERVASLIFLRLKRQVSSKAQLGLREDVSLTDFVIRSYGRIHKEVCRTLLTTLDREASEYVKAAVMEPLSCQVEQAKCFSFRACAARESSCLLHILDFQR